MLQVFDRLITVSAFIVPIVASCLAWKYREKESFPARRHRWVLGILSMPALLVFWILLNQVFDRLGTASISAHFIIGGVVLVMALTATAIRLLLKVTLTLAPDLESKKPDSPPEFIPYRPGKVANSAEEPNSSRNS